MVEYFNFSQYANNNGVIEVMVTTSHLMHYMFGYFLLVLIFLLPLISLMANNHSAERSLLYSSFFALLASIYFYVIDMINLSFPIWVFSIMLAVLLFIIWKYK